jgi:hypothetical protein
MTNQGNVKFPVSTPPHVPICHSPSVCFTTVTASTNPLVLAYSAGLLFQMYILESSNLIEFALYRFILLLLYIFSLQVTSMLYINWLVYKLFTSLILVIRLSPLLLVLVVRATFPFSDT